MSKTITLLEKNSSLGNKLKITGKGRCNLTFEGTEEDFRNNIVNNYKFMYSSFSNFNNEDVIDFFNNLGIPTKVERGGRIFPVSDRATDIVDALKTILTGGNNLEFGLAIIYSIISVIGCGAISLYMKVKSKSLSSELIKAEFTQWLMDTSLSTAVLVAFIIGIIISNTKLNFLNSYIDPGMTAVVSLVCIRIPIKGFIESFKEVICVKANDEINDDIYVLVKEIEEEYKFEESITRVSKVGRELRIEIDFVYNKDSKLKTLDQMDNVREEINDAIKHIDYKKWLNVSFTGNKKWAI